MLHVEEELLLAETEVDTSATEVETINSITTIAAMSITIVADTVDLHTR